MKKYLSLFTVIFSFVILTPIATAQSTNNFKIESFDADYYLSKDQKNVSKLKVTETIVAEFPNINQNHGIERAIPDEYKDNNLDLRIDSVKKEDGTNWNYSEKKTSGNKVLRIGDADKYVQGRQVYIIRYSLRDVITFYPDHDEFYWDINGDQWSQQFGSVSATIHLPNDLASKISLEPKCFTGTYGTTDSECSISKTQDTQTTQISVRSNRSLSANENISFVLGFKPSTFTKYKTDPRLILLIVVVALLLIGLPPFIAGVIMYRRWRAGGKDPEGRGVIIPQYSVPKEMNPILADVIINERLQTKSISATLIELCVKGYVKLYEVEKKKWLTKSEEYEVELIKDPSNLSSEQKKVVTMLFSQAAVGTKVNLNELKYKLHKEVKTLTTSISNKVAAEGYYVVNPQTAKSKYNGWGIFLLIIGIGPLFIFPPIVLATVGLAVAGVIVLAVGNAMPKRTQKGVDIKEYLLGVEDYMKMAEADRIKFLQAPDTAEKVDVADNKQMIKLYEKLLPYAVLFGIEKDWAKQFANLYEEGQSPSWYSGHSVFNAVLFSNAISGFNTVAASSFTSPSSSGSSGYSGGGGFSGGGGGGGGGGGW